MWNSNSSLFRKGSEILIKDLANWAEDNFSALCSIAGVTRNKSQQDQAGWDYIIDFPPEASVDLSSDLRPVDISARVQVKSRRSSKASARLKLSNALRFAKNLQPCFIVLYMVENNDSTPRIFAKHFWVDEISHTLKRIRTAHAAGRTDFNKQTITINFSSSDEKGDQLLDWMYKVIKEKSNRYEEEKSKIEQNAGFEDGWLHGTVSFAQEEMEDFVNHQIGLEPFAPNVELTIKQRRFGIDVPLPNHHGPPDRFRIQSHPNPCRVRFRRQMGDDIWLDGLCFQPNFTAVPTGFWKLRVVVEFMEFVISEAGVSTAKMHFVHSDQRSLPTWIAVVRLLAEFESHSLEVSIVRPGLPALDIEASFPVLFDSDDIEELSKVVSFLDFISKGILPKNLAFSLSEINTSWSDIARVHGLVNAGCKKFSLSIIWDPKKELGTAESIYFYDYVDVGVWSFSVIVYHPITKFEIVGANLTVECGNPRVAEAFVEECSGAEHLSVLRKRYDKARIMDRGKVLEILGGDFNGLMQTLSTSSSEDESLEV